MSVTKVTCQELPVAAYVDGELDAVEERTVERHLEGCAACRALVAGFPEDVADRTCGAGVAGQARDVAVGDNAADGNALDHPEDTASETRVSGQC